MHGARSPACLQVAHLSKSDQICLHSWPGFVPTLRLGSMIAAVAKVVATAQPPVEYTCTKYREAHSAVLGSAAYNKALDIADGVVKRVQVSVNSNIKSVCCMPIQDESRGDWRMSLHAGHICVPGGGQPALPCGQPPRRPCPGQADTLPSLYCCQGSSHSPNRRWLGVSCCTSTLCKLLSHGKWCKRLTLTWSARVHMSKGTNHICPCRRSW